eukprot:TRINITY_DN11607_c1_g1_i2.p1 TRINITY_DN11607_c1_g1~~TRINITY_DN11607_c1_g1_i2.p1  ORF type:complete len:678 (-),score=155.82 TRINITY_DN11607_c1_g1_i2:1078-3111(-)
MPKLRQVTLEDLRGNFHLPINKVAAKLGLCVTVLKQRCREHGIARWPFRKVRTLDTLISNLESKPPLEVVTAAISSHAAEERLRRLDSAKKTRNFLVANPNSAAHLKLGKPNGAVTSSKRFRFSSSLLANNVSASQTTPLLEGSDAPLPKPRKMRRHLTNSTKDEGPLVQEGSNSSSMHAISTNHVPGQAQLVRVPLFRNGSEREHFPEMTRSNVLFQSSWPDLTHFESFNGRGNVMIAPLSFPFSSSTSRESLYINKESISVYSQGKQEQHAFDQIEENFSSQRAHIPTSPGDSVREEIEQAPPMPPHWGESGQNRVALSLSPSANACAFTSPPFPLPSPPSPFPRSQFSIANGHVCSSSRDGEICGSPGFSSCIAPSSTPTHHLHSPASNTPLEPSSRSPSSLKSGGPLKPQPWKMGQFSPLAAVNLPSDSFLPMWSDLILRARKGGSAGTTPTSNVSNVPLRSPATGGAREGSVVSSISWQAQPHVQPQMQMEQQHSLLQMPDSSQEQQQKQQQQQQLGLQHPPQQQQQLNHKQKAQQQQQQQQEQPLQQKQHGQQPKNEQQQVQQRPLFPGTYEPLSPSYSTAESPKSVSSVPLLQLRRPHDTAPLPSSLAPHPLASPPMESLPSWPTGRPFTDPLRLQQLLCLSSSHELSEKQVDGVAFANSLGLAGWLPAP